jgi:hypothetical protein
MKGTSVIKIQNNEVDTNQIVAIFILRASVADHKVAADQPTTIWAGPIPSRKSELMVQTTPCLMRLSRKVHRTIHALEYHQSWLRASIMERPYNVKAIVRHLRWTCFASVKFEKWGLIAWIASLDPAAHTPFRDSTSTAQEYKRMRDYLVLRVRNQYEGKEVAYYHRHDWLAVSQNKVGSKIGVPEARRSRRLYWLELFTLGTVRIICQDDSSWLVWRYRTWLARDSS